MSSIIDDNFLNNLTVHTYHEGRTPKLVRSSPPRSMDSWNFDPNLWTWTNGAFMPTIIPHNPNLSAMDRLSLDVTYHNVFNKWTFEDFSNMQKYKAFYFK